MSWRHSSCSAAARLTLAHGLFGFQMDAVSRVNQAVEDRIGKGRIADVVVPVAHRQLAGHDAGTSTDAIIR
jgi:hypothetical protein